MYRDNSLMPSEAVRLLALGILAGGETRYAELAGEVRHFIARMVGPSLELVARPLELLKVEELVEPVEGSGAGDTEVLRITEDGRTELMRLLTSNVRPQVNDLSKLVIALKMRFLHLLPARDRRVQAQFLMEIFERELARLTDLRRHAAEAGGPFADWLDLEIEQTQARLAWFEALEARPG